MFVKGCRCLAARILNSLSVGEGSFYLGLRVDRACRTSILMVTRTWYAILWLCSVKGRCGDRRAGLSTMLIMFLGSKHTVANVEAGHKSSWGPIM